MDDAKDLVHAGAIGGNVDRIRLDSEDGQGDKREVIVCGNMHGFAGQSAVSPPSHSAYSGTPIALMCGRLNLLPNMSPAQTVMFKYSLSPMVRVSS